MGEVYNCEYEEKADIKLLLIYVFRKWRSLFVAALLLGLLFGGIKAVRTFIELQDPEKVEESVLDSERSIQNYETAKSQLTAQMEEYNKQIEDYQKYRENSLYMKIDPYAVYKESVVYSVSTGYQIMPSMSIQSPDWIRPVMSAYATIASSISMKDLPAEARAGMSEVWDTDSLEKMISVGFNAENGNLTVTVFADTEARAKMILQAAQKSIEDNKENVSQAIGKHNIVPISRTSVISVEQSIVNDHDQWLKNATALREAADRAADKYSKLKEPKDTSLSMGSVLKNGIKFGILGVVFGLFMACALFAFEFLLNGKLNDVNTLKYRYNARILAGLEKEQKKDPVNYLLNRIEGVDGSSKNNEKRLSVAAASLECLKKGGTVAVAGTASEEEKQKISEILQKQAAGNTVISVGNLLEDVEAVRQVRSSDAVILAETRFASAVTDIDKELELVNNMGVAFEGFIVL